MHEVEGEAGAVYARASERLLQAREELPGWGLSLDEPPVIEAELRLRKAHGRLLRRRERVVRGQRLGILLEDISERAVVVDEVCALT